VGLNAVLAALQNRGQALKRLIISDAERHPNSTFKTILETLKTLGHRYQTVPAATFKRFAPAAHQGIAAFFEEINPLDLEDFLKTIPLEGPYLIVALDRVEDPGNFGALFRSAWSLGAKAIFTAKDRSAALTPQALKAASGAVEKLPWVKVTNLVAAFSKLKELGFWVVGADSQDSGESLFDFKFPLRSVLVLGAEGKGLSRLTREKADYLVQIPLAGKSDSLNVASAGAIFLYAYRSQTRDA
jgi:23S rRNA (guanosine2251-2'-O)-methyltransferase